jgi:hypothetical protein
MLLVFALCPPRHDKRLQGPQMHLLQRQVNNHTIKMSGNRGVDNVINMEPTLHGQCRCGCSEFCRIRSCGYTAKFIHARRWLAMLESGEASSMKKIARRERVDDSYVSRMVNLTTLAPDNAVDSSVCGAHEFIGTLPLTRTTRTADAASPPRCGRHG